MPEIMQIDPKTHREQVVHLWWKAFGPEKKEEEIQEWFNPDDPHRLGMETVFGAKVDDQMVAMIGITNHIENRIRGVNLRFSGIAGVATLPEYRRDRLVRKAFEAFFQWANENGIVFSALGPFSYPFYEKFGYAMAGQMHNYKFPVTDLKRVNGPEDISFREYVPEKDAEGVMDAQRNMARFGSRVFEPLCQLQGKREKEHGYVFERDGQIVGYLEIRFKELAEWEKQMDVYYTWFSSDDVLPAMVDLVYRYGSQAKDITWEIDPEIPLEYFLKNPGHHERKRHGFMMIRVVQFKEFCQQVKVPLYASEPVVIKLIDEHCPWNTGVWKLIPVSGRLEIQPCDEEPEITFEPVQLSYALSGLLTANRLHRMGGLDCSSDAAERFSRIFPPDSYVSYVEF
ncbi:MAG: GNAT family N-acetyltransferase [Anaerolineae bacterium]|jgi:predicted acetyltransferase|nr:GNAT family N-acetyltransferase [Anaerolineae bacterium]